MSIEDIKQYVQMCAEDENVRAEAKKIGTNDLDGQIAHAETLGLHFDAGDVQALAKENMAQGELSDEDLESVAGGGGFNAAIGPFIPGPGTPITNPMYPGPGILTNPGKDSGW